MDFYVPRWEMFFDDMKREKQNFDEIAAQEKIRVMEEQWTMESNIPESPSPLSRDEYIELINDLIR